MYLDSCSPRFLRSYRWDLHKTQILLKSLYPILCACLKYSCAYKAVVTRTPLNMRGQHGIVASTNQLIAETVIRLIVEHQPIFTIGHNVYEFDNVTLACSLSPQSSLRNYFVPISSMIGETVSNAGFIMCLPGINNLDTLRCIRKAMPRRWGTLNSSSCALPFCASWILLAWSNRLFGRPSRFDLLKWWDPRFCCKKSSTSHQKIRNRPIHSQFNPFHPVVTTKNWFQSITNSTTSFITILSVTS